jgi:hypothetical protein
MQISGVTGLGQHHNLTTLLARFLHDQVSSGNVRLWWQAVCAALAQQQSLAQQQAPARQLFKGMAKQAMAGFVGVCGLAAAYLPVRGQAQAALFDDMLITIFNQQAGLQRQQPPQKQQVQQQQQQPVEGQGANPSQQATGAGWYEAAHPGLKPNDKYAFYERLAEGVHSHGVLTLLEQLETAQDVVLEAAAEQQEHISSHGIEGPVTGLLRLAGRRPASCSNGALASPEVVQQPADFSAGAAAVPPAADSAN